MEEQMKNTLIGLAVTAFLATGCAATTCDEANDYLLDECGVSGDGDEEDGAEVTCEPESMEACAASCTLAAPCAVFDGNLDPTNEDDQATLDEYNACLDAC
jgi:hypothetical protein